MAFTSLLAVYSAGLLAFVGALFGVAIARVLWADDLRHAQRLRDVWDTTQALLESRIRSQEEIIAIQKRRLGE